MAELYFRRLHGSALKEVSARVSLAPKDSQTYIYWAEVLHILRGKLAKARSQFLPIAKEGNA